MALKHKAELSKLGTVDDICLKQGMRVGVVCFLKNIADRVGLSKALGHDQQGKLALWQVFARLIDQGSRLSAVRLAESHSACDLLGIDPFHEDHLYANLYWLTQNQARIEKDLFLLRFGKNPPRLFLYDVTSSYLEGVDNELGSFGYNRDGKRGKKQLVIGLLTDSDGKPVAVRVFEGNTQDSQTVAEQVRLLAETFGVSKITFVGDRGMIKQTQQKLLNDQSFHYITAITKSQIKNLIRHGVFQMELFEDRICEIISDGIRYILRRNRYRAEELAQSRADKLNALKALVEQRNAYLQDHPRAKVEVAQRRIQEKANRLKIADWVKVCITQRSIDLFIDTAKEREKHQFDGCYVIQTDLPKQEAAAEVVHDRYKDLAGVERAFRTMKTGHLEVRPAFVRKEFSTRGHVFVVMLAYLLEREIDSYWRGLETTVAEGIDELGTLRAVEITLANTTCQKMPIPTGLSKQLLDAADVRLPSVLPARTVHVATRKKLKSERKSI